MYENLIETLRFCAKNGDCHDCPNEKPCAGAMGDGLYCEAADAIEELQAGEKKFLRNISALDMENENLKRARRWIPVTERLPERFSPMIVFGNGVVGCGDFVGFAEPAHCASWDCDTSEIETVSHWMPLPAPPKEET